MSTRNLDFFLNPKSIAVVGATDRPESVGQVLMKNILAAGFAGSIYPVNLNRSIVHGLKAYRSVSELPAVPDCAIIAIPPALVPDVVGELGRLGTKAVVVITAGLAEGSLKSAGKNSVRIIGPNCVGIQIPGAKLNASFSATQALNGNLAFVTQSGAMATTIVDWATSRGIGFSQVLSLGDMSDVDFGDILQFLSADTSSKAILLYVESITHPKKFLAAARAAAKNKPVIVVKAGRFPEGARAAATHTGALAGSDKVYDAVFRKTGLLRVLELEEMFEAAEILSRVKIPGGDRLAILTNGGGAGVLATDELMEHRGTLAALTPSTIERLNAILPPTWSHANPIDIIGDADADRYRQSLAVVLQDVGVDSVLTLNCPTAIVDSAVVAEEVVRAAAESGQTKNILAVWMGGNKQNKAREIFERSGVPSYSTPEGGVRAFMHLARYRQSQMALTADSDSFCDLAVNQNKAKTILDSSRGKKWLSGPDSRAVLASYGIPVVRSWTAHCADEAVRLASGVHGAVALKILSPDITHKSDVGGVALNLSNSEDIRQAAKVMLDAVKSKLPSARIEGFSIEEMIQKSKAFELIVGMTQDPQFGPVLLFGEGGVAVEVIEDTALELPPVGLKAAHDLMRRTRIFQRLKGFRAFPPVNLDEIALTIVKISRLVTDFPEIQGLDINPLIADSHKVLALDARIQLC